MLDIVCEVIPRACYVNWCATVLMQDPLKFSHFHYWIVILSDSFFDCRWQYSLVHVPTTRQHGNSHRMG